LRGANVSLTIPAGEITNRFSLRFSNGTLSSTEFDSSPTTVFFNTTENNIEIINNQILEIEEATLFSLLGQKISNWKLNSSEKSIKIPVKNIETGVYIVKIKTTDNLYFSQKIIVK
jgi:hypothetical protein